MHPTEARALWEDRVLVCGTTLVKSTAGKERKDTFQRDREHPLAIGSLYWPILKGGVSANQWSYPL